MHKKSIEAAEKLKAEDDVVDERENRDKDEFRSESIASLRAKAQVHSAKVMEALGGSTNHSKPTNLPPGAIAHNHNSLLKREYCNLVQQQS